ncbi:MULTISPECIES: hypothetical protein [unclassified Streptomyces]|uniref:hypothetical protein n=1 Tax=unclassified Streptomyces TaxID=2593676 RepID=UPI0019090126|nr:hypothetical protein [Streptomyces sp. HSG2]
MFEDSGTAYVANAPSGSLEERNQGYVVPRFVSPVSATPGVVGCLALVSGVGLSVAGLAALTNAVG